MTRRLVPAVLVLALLGGCGSDDEEGGGATSEPQQTQTQAQEGPSDQTQVREMAARYLEAYAKRDWKKVCATLSPKARARFARKGGSCVKVYRETAERNRSDKFLLVSEVRVNGDRATVDVSVNGDPDEKPVKMYAAKIDGKWWLYIKRAAKGAA